MLKNVYVLLFDSGNEDEWHSLPGSWDLDVVRNVCDSFWLWQEIASWVTTNHRHIVIVTCHIFPQKQTALVSSAEDDHESYRTFSLLNLKLVFNNLIFFPNYNVPVVFINSVALIMFSRVPTSPTPVGRSWHTLTAVSDSSLFLFGGLSIDCKPMSKEISKKSRPFQFYITSVLSPN